MEVYFFPFRENIFSGLRVIDIRDEDYFFSKKFFFEWPDIILGLPVIDTIDGCCMFAGIEGIDRRALI